MLTTALPAEALGSLSAGEQRHADIGADRAVLAPPSPGTSPLRAVLFRAKGRFLGRFSF